MAAMSDLEYLSLTKPRRALFKTGRFFAAIPGKLLNLLIAIGQFFVRVGVFFKEMFINIVTTFKNGDWKTRVSYFIMGFGNLSRGQIFRGLLFLLFEIAFVLYMILVGGKYLGDLGTLGTKEASESGGILIAGDNSFKILLYSIISLVFIIALFATWYMNILQNKIAQEILATGKPLKSGKQDMQSLVDDQFHKTLLALPVLGIAVFTVLPIVFMILIAFTNYDSSHTPPNNLFTWVGLDNFNSIFSFGVGGANFSATFGEILVWTLVWAFFATFTNYFLGMLVAMAINKKGIKLKKLWRTVLVISIAIPQFISLLYVSKMFAEDGIINGIVVACGGTKIPFWTDKWLARIMVIVINIWIGIPYLMLIISGVLMNIPQDLYESARIDGASSWKMYTKITLPYMLFITGPYLLTSFTGNMNNFNVIYLLSGGAPTDVNLTGGAGHSDLLITWLFKLTVDHQNYKMASVIGIMVFLVVAIISLVVYNLLPSMKNEEEFQ